MRAGARTPEELDTLLEDAFVMRDRTVLAELFVDQAVLSGGAVVLARGRSEIAQAAEAMWSRDELYLAAPLRVLQTRRTALIAGPCATSVAQRSKDGAWRYAIAVLHPNHNHQGAHDEQFNNPSAGTLNSRERGRGPLVVGEPRNPQDDR